MKNYKPIKLLDKNTAQKIAAGEVIERPASVVRELLDNSIDAGATKIQLELISGGINSIKVTDNGHGMSKEDLQICTETHSTSKISNIQDLLSISSLGFRGEALSSINAVSDLEITTTRNGPEAWKLSLNKIHPTSLHKGTIVSVKNLFENFPARKQFLKRASSEANQCKQIFTEKAMANPDIEMTLTNESGIALKLLPQNSYKNRCLSALSIKEPDTLFHEINGMGENFSFSTVLSLPDIFKHDRRYIYIFVNGRRITDYGLVQAVEYGAEGFFPNGGHPVAFVFLTIDPASVDFNIHPAKKEARFSNYSAIHHAISSTVGRFYRHHAIAKLKEDQSDTTPTLSFHESEIRTTNTFQNFNTRKLYAENTSEAITQYSASPLNIQEKYNYQSTPIDIPKINFRFLGQVAGTFLAIEKNDSLYLIDQHAAHERIIFEDMKKNLGLSQELLVPYKITTENLEEDKVIQNNIPTLTQLGFKITQEKNSVWVISATPVRWHGTEKDLEQDLRKIAQSQSDILHDILAMSSCRAACKDGDILDPTTAFKIVEQTLALPEPLCPHGRPLWTVITKDELFKRVKRT